MCKHKNVWPFWGSWRISCSLPSHSVGFIGLPVIQQQFHIKNLQPNFSVYHSWMSNWICFNAWLSHQQFLNSGVLWNLHIFEHTSQCTWVQEFVEHEKLIDKSNEIRKTITPWWSGLEKSTHIVLTFRWLLCLKLVEESYCYIQGMIGLAEIS
jgi:hypothetical protein